MDKLKLRVFLFIVMTVLILSLFASKANRVVIRVQNPTESLFSQFQDEDIEILRLQESVFVDLFLDYTFLQGPLFVGYDIEILFSETEMLENMQIKTRDLPGYRNYSQILSELEALANEYSDLAALYNIGTTQGSTYFNQGNSNYNQYQDHYIWALKITTNPDIPNDRPAVYFNGVHHAREPISAEMVMLIGYHLLNEYGTDPHITYLVENTEIWLIPLLNPDGYRLVTTQTNINWRKNIRDNNNSGQFNSGVDGVDLNRNYNHEWALIPNQSALNYSGPTPFSEPELWGLQNLWESRKFIAGISYHSYGEMVLFPPGYTAGLYSPDYAAQSSLALAMAQTIPKLNGNTHYSAMNSWQFYPATGTSEDYAYCVHGIFAFTLEMGTSFIPTHTLAQQICEDNLEAALVLLRRGQKSLLTGIIADYTSQTTLSAEAYITGIDDTGVYRAPYTSCDTFGRYYRLLLPGDYEVQFRAAGFFPTPYISFSINDTIRTELDIELIQLFPVTALYSQSATDHLLIWWDEPPGAVPEGDSSNIRLPYEISEPIGYYVFRDNLLQNEGELLTGLVYQDFDVVEGITYSYGVRAVYTDGEAEISHFLNTMFQNQYSAPQNVTIAVTEDVVTINWNEVVGAVYYKIFTTDDLSGNSWQELDQTESHSWQEPAWTQRVFYRVVAVFEE